MSLRALSARTLTTLRAGLALNMTSSLVNGLIPLRALVAGFWMTMIFMRPGTARTPAPFLPTALPISCERESKTDFTCLRESWVELAMLLMTSLFEAGFAEFAIVLPLLSQNGGSFRDARSLRQNRGFCKFFADINRIFRGFCTNCGKLALIWLKIGHFQPHEVADLLDRQVGRGIGTDGLEVKSVMPLPGKNSCQFLAPLLLDGSQDPHFVVHQHVMIGRKAGLDVCQHLVLMNVNQHVARDCIGDSRSLHLARLKHHVPIGKNDRQAPLPAMFDRVQRIGKESIGEGIINQKGRDRKELCIGRIFHA